jgi:hypothetical protein
VTIDSPAGREYLGDANQQDVESLALIPRLANANFLRAVKFWQGRRSFRAVGESCVTNLIPDPSYTGIQATLTTCDLDSDINVKLRVCSLKRLSRKGWGQTSTLSNKVIISLGESGLVLPKGMKGVAYEQ